MSNHQKADTREPEQPEQAAQRASGPDGLHAYPDNITAHVMSPVDEDKPVQPTVTPLPYRSILALCLGRVADGMMFTIILPYINEMVHGMGVDEEDVGKWSAAAVSAQCVMEILDTQGRCRTRVDGLADPHRKPCTMPLVQSPVHTLLIWATNMDESQCI